MDGENTKWLETEMILKTQNNVKYNRYIRWKERLWNVPSDRHTSAMTVKDETQYV
jgi:hypothetical protein